MPAALAREERSAQKSRPSSADKSRTAQLFVAMMSSAEKSRLRSEKPEQRRGTEQRQRTAGQEHRITGT